MKEEVLKALRHRGWISGEKLGRDLGISRTAVWKDVNGLRSEGYQIESVPSKGYLFVSAPDSLLPGEIQEGLRTHVLGRKMVYRSEIGSTQVLAKSLATGGAGDGTVVISEKQSGGFGRLGRKWHSLAGSIFLSVIMRPAIHPLEALKFPVIAGVAVCGAIERVTGLSPQLKWPNDVILGGKKAGGILTEMAAEMDRVNYLIIGIGVNVNTAKSVIPDDIREIATSLKVQGRKEFSRVRLVRAILEELELRCDEYQKAGFEPVRKKWEELSCNIGKPVTITSGREAISGKAVTMDAEGSLVVRGTDGTLSRVRYGDVSLRAAGDKAVRNAHRK